MNAYVCIYMTHIHIYDTYTYINTFFVSGVWAIIPSTLVTINWTAFNASLQTALYNIYIYIYIVRLRIHM
jgi:hypothetical protein